MTTKIDKFVTNPENMFEVARRELKKREGRSAWSKGVNEYAFELLESLEWAINDGYFEKEDIKSRNLLEKCLLNGADNWNDFSWGGCSLIYNADIAERLCCPSELKKTRNGERRPNAREEWLDTQTRALFQAYNRLVKVLNVVMK